ncbi:MAG: hypothetical protein K4571_14340 [Deltaproteobacteria bacterium]
MRTEGNQAVLYDIFSYCIGRAAFALAMDAGSIITMQQDFEKLPVDCVGLNPGSVTRKVLKRLSYIYLRLFADDWYCSSRLRQMEQIGWHFPPLSCGTNLFYISFKPLNISLKEKPEKGGIRVFTPGRTS